MIGQNGERGGLWRTFSTWGGKQGRSSAVVERRGEEGRRGRKSPKYLFLYYKKNTLYLSNKFLFYFTIKFQINNRLKMKVTVGK